MTRLVYELFYFYYHVGCPALLLCAEHPEGCCRNATAGVHLSE